MPRDGDGSPPDLRSPHPHERYIREEALLEGEPVKKLGSDVQRAALRKLRILDAATKVNDLRTPPGNRLGRNHVG